MHCKDMKKLLHSEINKKWLRKSLRHYEKKHPLLIRFLASLRNDGSLHKKEDEEGGGERRLRRLSPPPSSHKSLIVIPNAAKRNEESHPQRTEIPFCNGTSL